jgi:hypothetical protein
MAGSVFTSAARERVITIVVAAISPYVGATMAGASVRGFCTRLGLDGPALDRAQVTRLLDALAPGLDVYVGKEKAAIVVREIWAALDLQGTRA